ncbi:MAG: TonB-dependent receptor [Gammaproteobacteria bacterium AqS3]|nr:TonB-dependent receptor [Gammaproteobacteria bacterium AqS3]
MGNPAGNSGGNSGEMEEIIVTDSAEGRQTEMTRQTRQLLGAAGAAGDPLQALYALPGVATADADGPVGTEPVIRGSAPEDNVYYIDGIPATYLFHLFGDSIFDRHLIHSFELHPAAFSSRYGNATGGVIDVRLRTPRNQDFTATLHTSILSAGALLESGIGERQAFYLSFRRSMMDLLISEEDVNEAAGTAGVTIDRFPVSEDYQAKYVIDIDDGNRLTLLAAGASDFIGVTFGESFDGFRDPDFAGPAELDRSFDSLGLEWSRHGDGGRFTSVLSRIENRDHLDYGAGQRQHIRFQRHISRSRYQRAPGGGHELSAGVSLEHSRYDLDFNAKISPCGSLDRDCPTVRRRAYDVYVGTLSVSAYELFAEDEWAVDDQNTLRLGVYLSDDDHTRDARLEPRMRWERAISERLSSFVSIGQYSQIPQLNESMPALGNPDLDRIKADHYVWGIRQLLGGGLNWSWSAEVYLKDMTDLVISSRQDPLADNYSNNAGGRSYGAEFLLRRELSEGWFGWAALSLSRSDRSNGATGEALEFEHDKPVLFSLVLNRRIGERWMLGVKWNYQSGARHTPIVALAPDASDRSVLNPVYGALHSERYPAYHRLDFRIEYATPKDWGYRKFYADILNVYDRRNVEEYVYAPDGADLIRPPPGFARDIPVRAETGEGLFPSLGFEIQF